MQQLIFVLDPMCSWCWGFEPIIKELKTLHAERFHFSLIMGGLRTKGDMPWTEESRNYLAKNWKAVTQATHQPFNFSILKRRDFQYDTYPASKAVISVRELWGEEASFQYFEMIQKAFYQKNQDITSIDILIKYIKEDKEKFITFYKSKRAEILMRHDFSKARSMGANAFPSVVKIDADGHMVCQKGYKTTDEILKF